MSQIIINKPKKFPALAAIVSRLETITVASVAAAGGVTPRQAEGWLNKQYYRGALERTGVRRFARTALWKELNA